MHIIWQGKILHYHDYHYVEKYYFIFDQADPVFYKSILVHIGSYEFWVLIALIYSGC